MSEESEAFLTRWSKRKAEARRGPDGGEPPSGALQEPAAVAETSSDDLRPASTEGNEEGEIALADLPPIDSISASTDLTSWLQKKVPDVWKKAALRRIWTADPAISQFIGLSENAWDWNAPDGIPGFGPMRATDDVAQLLAQVIGQVPHSPNDAPEAENRAAEVSGTTPIELGPPADQTHPAMPAADETLSGQVPPSPASNASEDLGNTGERPLIRRRRGGGALPG